MCACACNVCIFVRKNLYMPECPVTLSRMGWRTFHKVTLKLTFGDDFLSRSFCCHV